jgi:hypothetical protein
MDMSTDPAIVIDDGTGIDYRIFSDTTPGLKDCTGHHLCALTEHDIRRQYRGRVRHRPKMVAFLLEPQKNVTAQVGAGSRPDTVYQHNAGRRMTEQRLVIAKKRYRRGPAGRNFLCHTAQNRGTGLDQGLDQHPCMSSCTDNQRRQAHGSITSSAA